jgi:Flp pilus assembly protein TadB
MGWFELLSVAGIAASIAGAILAWQTRDTKKLLDRMDARSGAQHPQTQGLIERMDQRWQATAERLDRAAEQRAETLKVLLERRT